MNLRMIIPTRLKKSLSRDRPKSWWITGRKLSQIIALTVFIGLFVLSRQGGIQTVLINFPMRLDPLQGLSNLISSRTFLAGSAIGLITILLTIGFGRAWCGWICPLGTVLDFIPLNYWRRKRNFPSDAWRRGKYSLVIIILIAAVLGNLTLLFLDPLSIFFRSLATAIWPALDQIVIGIETTLYQIPSLTALLSTIDGALRPVILPSEPVFYQEGIFFAGLFVGLVLLNFFAPRFWCRYLCPLGGLLGWISRIAIFRREVGEECKGCKLCSTACPTGTIDPLRNYASDPAECIMCMDCLGNCPKGVVSFKPNLKLSQGMPYDPTRRIALLSFGAAITSIALFRSNQLAKREQPFLIRPPGARENNTDVISMSRCTRCNECVRICPTSGLQPAVTEAGLEGFATPVLIPRLGYCDYSCNACGQVCPVEAIPPFSLGEKRIQVIGRAYIDENRCIPWSDHKPCVVCEEMCPLPKKAIQLEDKEVWGPEGVTVSIQLPHVLRDSCIGCGICEYKCPVSGEAAIRVYIPQTEVPF